MGTFSLLYTGKEGDDCTYAADWNWLSKNEWTRSEKDGLEWYPKNLNKESYLAILERFGLKDHTDEFPLKMIMSMSPATLIAARREKEKSFGLRTIQVTSDIIGDHILAENCH